MHDVASTSGGKEPLFVLELFDHDSKSSIDSRICCDIAEGAAAFQKPALPETICFFGFLLFSLLFVAVRLSGHSPRFDQGDLAGIA